MSLEIMIIATCIYGTQDPCSDLGKYYYSYRKLDVMVEEFKDNNRTLTEYSTPVITAAGIIQAGRLTIPLLRRNDNTITLTGGHRDISLLYVRPF